MAILPGTREWVSRPELEVRNSYCPGPGKRRNLKDESQQEKTEVRSKDESYYKDGSYQKTKVTKRRKLPTDES